MSGPNTVSDRTVNFEVNYSISKYTVPGQKMGVTLILLRMSGSNMPSVIEL